MIKTLAEALSERGYDTLTAVQEAVNAPEVQDADLLVSAQTGSGKTVGFGLAIARTLLGDAETMGPAAAPLALVIAPTRELAFQVMRELGWLYAKAGARVVSCVGGMDMRDERRALERGAHIVVGTPGRLRDHIQRGSLDMTNLRAIVLDEADEMLDLGFREDLEFMLGQAPEDRRTLLFSATVPPMIAKLAKQFQKDAVRITTLSGDSQHADITYQAMRVAQSDAENAIINVLRFHEAQNAIVFANTRAAVNRLMARFANRGFAVVALSGELSQTERTHALQAMRDGRARVCVATDVAARGIDLPNLKLVIHADLPSNAEGLLHRSGRTGRAGRKGTSALIITPRDVKKAERLLKTAKIEAEWTAAPTAEEILRRDEERLLSDPVWDEDVTEDQAAFAAKLLTLHSAEKIAAAYLRLAQSRHSAPEDLSPPDARSAPRERTPFGPSVWFSLSVGRDDKAEARWLLPLLCRAGNLDKESIGAIRVQQSETFVELTAASVPGLLAGLSDDGVLEDGVRMRQLDSAPDLGRPERSTGPRNAPPRDKPRYEKSTEARPKPYKERADAAHHDTQKPPAPKRWTPDRVKSDAPETFERATPRPQYDHDKPRAKPQGPKRQFSDAPPRRKDKPREDLVASTDGAVKKWSSSKPAKPRDPNAKPRGDKPAGKPPTTRANAADTSKRMSRPGKPDRAKPGGAKPGKPKFRKDGGKAPPRRTDK